MWGWVLRARSLSFAFAHGLPSVRAAGWFDLCPPFTPGSRRRVAALLSMFKSMRRRACRHAGVEWGGGQQRQRRKEKDAK